MNIADVLAQRKIISREDAKKYTEESTTSGKNLISILKKAGIKIKDIEHAERTLTDVPTADVLKSAITPELLKYIPQEPAETYGIVPIGFEDNVLFVGVTDPDNLDARDALAFLSAKTGIPYKIYLISQSDFDEVFSMYKGLNEVVTKALSELDVSLEEVKKEVEQNTGAKVISEEKDNAEEIKVVEDAPVTKIVATILRYATEGGASDVHIEPMRENIRVRFRVDGILNTSLVLPKEVASAVVARIKILSNMKLDEKRRPQDGRFSANFDQRKIDFRVSTFPTFYGEKVVMRILDQSKGVKKIDELGLSETNLATLKKALKRPYGIILISGPTGSGKSTTLYSMLGELDKDTKNILSLEDPIEYNIEGISQSQVKPDIGYTFANGLRTTLRQDPDIIMVGEIRDKETAQLAIQAALTGHLVLSTIHTNNAFGVIPRLVDMGVDPYLIAPTLVLAMAQRLVRKLCDGGGRAVPVEGAIKIMIDKEFENVGAEERKKLPTSKAVYMIESSPICPNGTSGRTIVTEMLEVDKDIENLILKDPTEQSISAVARKKGMLNMRQDAIIKALKREIPFEEITEV